MSDKEELLSRLFELGDFMVKALDANEQRLTQAQKVIDAYAREIERLRAYEHSHDIPDDERERPYESEHRVTADERRPRMADHLVEDERPNEFDRSEAGDT